MNIECDGEALEELKTAFRFNDAVLRSLVLARRKAITEASPIAQSKDENTSRDNRERDQSSHTGASEEPLSEDHSEESLPLVEDTAESAEEAVEPAHKGEVDEEIEKEN